MGNIVNIRAVHLDLKGMPPTFERLIELLDVFNAGGYNAILVEWEDMFPWAVDTRFRCETAYTPVQVIEFQYQAKEKGFEIIPLVQSLGHLENFLRLDDYAHLRELSDRSDCINPLCDGAIDFIAALIDDVLSLSGGIRYFHIGGDEVYAFGKNHDTSEYINKNGKAELFLKHVQPLCDKLSKQDIRPILWHDMMIDWDLGSLKKVAPNADVCVWGYVDTPYETERHYNIKYIEKFQKAGITMWGAAAYKGADGASIDMPDPCKRIKNALGWADVAKQFEYRGLIATGWSRYNTTRIQCETIEATLNSLLYIGWILATGENTIDYEERSLEALKTIGQLEGFEKCRNAASQFDIKRRIFWCWLQTFYEQGVLDEIQPDRGASEILDMTCDNLQLLLAETNECIPQFVDVFDGLVPQVWIDEYIQTRLDAMQKACEDMRIRIMEEWKGRETVRESECIAQVEA